MNEEEKNADKLVKSLKDWEKIHFIVKDRCYARLTYNEIYLLLALIEKLQKENEELKKYKEYYSSAKQLVDNNYIHKQKVKDKIEKLNKIEKDLQNSISMEEREEYSDANISWDLMNINIRREELEELIEEREEKE